ncbi:hypothetical protein ACFQZX_08655 [Mucilaginibacter litoreus]|uniref:Uncharacterized protein n=1 Tax=Mucilaginibacter litoreus TaxID=1048221 RepID=A0ABW3AS61_9SPHI
MMRKLFALVFLLFICKASFAQFIFDIKGKNLSYVKGFEKSAKGKITTLSAHYINPPDVAQPVVYRRAEANVPDLLVYYFPNVQDSTINYILYEWDEANFAKDAQAVKQPAAKLEQYISRYKALLAKVSADFGNPETTGSLDNTSLIETGRFKRKDIFVKNGIEVEMYIALSNKQVNNGIVSIMPTHRIRMYVRQTNTDSR